MFKGRFCSVFAFAHPRWFAYLPRRLLQKLSLNIDVIRHILPSLYLLGRSAGGHAFSVPFASICGFIGLLKGYDFYFKKCSEIHRLVVVVPFVRNRILSRDPLWFKSLLSSRMRSSGSNSI